MYGAGSAGGSRVDALAGLLRVCGGATMSAQAVRIFVSTEPQDMRRGFERLANVVREELGPMFWDLERRRWPYAPADTATGRTSRQRSSFHRGGLKHHQLAPVGPLPVVAERRGLFRRPGLQQAPCSCATKRGGQNSVLQAFSAGRGVVVYRSRQR